MVATAAMAITAMAMPVSLMTSTMPVVVTRLAALLVCLVLAYCGWLAVHRGLADAVAEQARTEMRGWDEAALEAVSVHNALDLMLRANELDPGHPTYLHRLGRLSHLLMGLELAQRDEWAGRAKGYYRESLIARPAWPITWANLALVKADQLEFDAEMDLALANAMRLGPWEPGVLVMMANMATTRGQFLTSDIRAMLGANVARGLISPVSGVTANVLGMLAGAELNTETLSALEKLLATNDWNRNPDQLMQVALTYYNRWQPENLPLIRERLLSEIISRPHTVRFLSEKKRLLQLCPYLPRKPKFRNACHRS
jgi:hypothetical protein